MNAFPRLETESFLAWIADNSAMGIHRSGYNGVASLVPRHNGNNLFVPALAGLNYETISLSGLPRFQHPRGPHEPRRFPMHIESADEERVTLVQPETPHAHVSARITFRVEEPCYLHQRIELTFHRRFCPEDRNNTFDSVFASYMHVPPDRHVYLKLDPASAPLADWVGLTREDHDIDRLLARPLPSDREITSEEHLQLMSAQPVMTRKTSADANWPPMPWRKEPGAELSFYYGLCHDRLFLMMFARPERFRFAYSPCGGGKSPAWNPAWDYKLHLDDADVGRTYAWDLCLAVKAYASREDIVGEVERYRNKGEPG